ncbi:hypothetical protein TIFTF001_000947 [Ficus carica]|uniref:NADP-dependent oxidoreductase domain-containing protein n=1 Tax=Ficus carica TaxID=3494 RepID=A0AA87ZJQ1_FICCA|nr:hypothetical protein TIFTF001_000947 [Ficus carica]
MKIGAMRQPEFHIIQMEGRAFFPLQRAQGDWSILGGVLQRMKGSQQCTFVGWEWAAVSLSSTAVYSQALSGLAAALQCLFGTLQSAVRKLGIGIVPYSPLGRGFFGGKGIVESLSANSFLVSHPRFQVENLEKNKNLYAKMEKLAAKHGCTPAQLALAWVLHQGHDVVPIPGTTKTKNLDDNIGALKVKLSKEDIEEICELVPINEVAGDRIQDAFIRVSWKFANTPLKTGHGKIPA